MKNHRILYFILTLIISSTVFSQVKFEGAPPGTIIVESELAKNIFIGSPSLLVLPNGDYLASHDFFGKSLLVGITHIYKSSNKGETWSKIAELKPQFWSTLFLVGNNVYLMGTTKEYGDVIIRRSTDFGKSWTKPIDKNSGIILNDGDYHTAPVPVVIHKGRIWRSMEDRFPPTDWGIFFRTFVMSAPIDSDLLKAENWSSTNRIAYNQLWPGSAWLEGNVVKTPHGYLWNILRNHTEEGGNAAITKVGLTGKVLTFDPQNGFIDFPGGSVKFTIRHDSVSNKYFSLTNFIQEKYRGGNPERTRNTLALISSVDLINWEVDQIILENDDVSSVGFQYVDFRFDGEDIIFLSRTAYYSSDNSKTTQHNSNFLTFHRVKNFRE